MAGGGSLMNSGCAYMPGLVSLTVSLADIDECSEGSDSCEQLCNNTEGYYLCSCLDGYSLRSNNLSCQGSAMISMMLVYEVYILIFRHK